MKAPLFRQFLPVFQADSLQKGALQSETPEPCFQKEGCVWNLISGGLGGVPPAAGNSEKGDVLNKTKDKKGTGPFLSQDYPATAAETFQLLKKRKSTAVMDANCPIQKMNIHLMISAFISARSTFVATLSRRAELFVSKAVSTASAILVACFSSKAGRSTSKIFNVFAYAIKTSYTNIINSAVKFVNHAPMFQAFRLSFRRSAKRLRNFARNSRKEGHLKTASSEKRSIVARATILDKKGTGPFLFRRVFYLLCDGNDSNKVRGLLKLLKKQLTFPFLQNYLLKKRKSTAVMDANCPIQKMNIHLMISALSFPISSCISIRRFAKSSFVATLSRRAELFVSRAVSTASEILVACFSSKAGRSTSKIFNVFAYAIKTSYTDIVNSPVKFVNCRVNKKGPVPFLSARPGGGGNNSCLSGISVPADFIGGDTLTGTGKPRSYAGNTISTGAEA